MLAIFKKEKKPAFSYDPAAQQPAVRSSICTGEMTLGFIDRDTGKFHEAMLARSQDELERFCRDTGTSHGEIRRIY